MRDFGKKEGQKMFVVRKYIWAKTLMEARRLDRKTEPQEIWIDDEWKNDQKKNLSTAIGFDDGKNQDDE